MFDGVATNAERIPEENPIIRTIGNPLRPPFTITRDEIDLAVDSLDQALDIIDDKFVKN